MSIIFLRQQDIINSYKYKILIIGAGGIGSPATLILAKMGYKNIKVIDSDTIEEHNLSNQFYKISQIGKAKVEALKENILEYTGTEIKIEKKKIEETFEEQIENTIVISAVDNMKTRKIVFDKIKYKINSYLIDCRVTYPYLYLYTVRTTDIDDIKNYQNTLYSDEEADRGRCTAQCTFYTSMMAGTLIANIVRNIEMNGHVPYTIKVCFDPVQFIVG
jgi:hypothetical protein